MKIIVYLLRNITKINIEHINLAIKDFKDKGFPDGFKASAYFDIEVEGALYPLKPIVAYANYQAIREKPLSVWAYPY